MKLGMKTENAKWIYDTDTGKLRCHGDTARFRVYDSPTPEQFWRDTNGLWNTFVRIKRPWYLFFLPEELSFDTHVYYWYEQEKAKVMKEFLN